MPPLLFPEWAPDAPDLGTTAREASGLIAEKDGYRPFKALATTSSALTARAQGAAWFRAPDGTTKNFAGDATKLYLLSGSTWNSATRQLTALVITNITQANPGVVTYTGTDPSNGDTVYIASVAGMTQVNGLYFTVANVNAGANTFELSGVNTTGYTAYSSGGTAAVVSFYATDGTGNWRFSQFGASAYATNGQAALQAFNLSSSSFWADASGSPPVADFIATVRRFLVLGKVASYPQRVQWSGDNNATTWTSSATTLADYQDLPDGGAVTGLVGGEVGLVFQESAVTRMAFEGSPTVFRFDKIANEIGATIPNSVASWHNLAFFCHRSGFHMVQNAQQVVPIGRERVDRWFWGHLDQSTMHRVTTAIDPVNSLYIVSFPTGAAGTPEEILIYNWKADRWSRATATCEMIYSGATQQSWTLEDLDAFTSIELVPFSLDSSYWTGSRQLLLAGFYTDHKSGTFSGANLAASIDTQEFQPIPGRRARLLSARPLVDGGSPTISVGTRSTQQGIVAWSPARSMARDGLVPLRAEGRYHRLRCSMPAGSTFQYMQGIDDLDFRPAGSR